MCFLLCMLQSDGRGGGANCPGPRTPMQRPGVSKRSSESATGIITSMRFIGGNAYTFTIWIGSMDTYRPTRSVVFSGHCLGLATC